jgi:hypothetical protein
MRENKYLPIIGAGAALAIIYFLFFRKKRSEVLEQQALQQEGGSTTPTYPNSQYFAWANKLEQSMFDVGTDEDAIYDVFSKLKNNGDFIKLKQAFGVREYTGGFVPGFLSPDLSLDGWLQQELDSSEILQLNNILKNKGIIYRV